MASKSILCSSSCVDETVLEFEPMHKIVRGLKLHKVHSNHIAIVAMYLHIE